MKTIDMIAGRVVLAVLLAGFAFLSDPGLAKAGQPGEGFAKAGKHISYEYENWDKPANNCHLLEVELEVDGWRFTDAKCSKGKVHSKSENKLVFMQYDARGPKCEVSLRTGHGKSQYKSVIGFQQNLCALKAGNITVSYISGSSPTFRRYEGSRRKRRAGKVIIKEMNPQ